jgi:hypothetical protein
MLTATAERSKSFTRVCLPAPVARKAATTSLSTLICKDSLVRPAGLPRLRRMAACSAGSASRKRRAVWSSADVKGASSACVRGLICLVMDSLLCLVGATHADDAHIVAAPGKNDDMQFSVQHGDGGLSFLAVFAARPINNHLIAPIAFMCRCETQAMLGEVGDALLFISKKYILNIAINNTFVNVPKNLLTPNHAQKGLKTWTNKAFGTPHYLSHCGFIPLAILELLNRATISSLSAILSRERSQSSLLSLPARSLRLRFNQRQNAEIGIDGICSVNRRFLSFDCRARQSQSDLLGIGQHHSFSMVSVDSACHGRKAGLGSLSPCRAKKLLTPNHAQKGLKTWTNKQSLPPRLTLRSSLQKATEWTISMNWSRLPAPLPRLSLLGFRGCLQRHRHLLIQRNSLCRRDRLALADNHGGGQSCGGFFDIGTCNHLSFSMVSVDSACHGRKAGRGSLSPARAKNLLTLITIADLNDGAHDSRGAA